MLLDGYAWTVETDLKDCFPSFDGEELYKFLYLPEKVTRSVIMASTLNITLAITYLTISALQMAMRVIPSPLPKSSQKPGAAFLKGRPRLLSLLKCW